MGESLHEISWNWNLWWVCPFICVLFFDKQLLLLTSEWEKLALASFSDHFYRYLNSLTLSHITYLGFWVSRSIFKLHETGLQNYVDINLNILQLSGYGDFIKVLMSDLI